MAEGHSDEKLMTIFNEIDKDRDGSLSEQEIESLMMNKFKMDQKRAAFIAKVGVEISFERFILSPIPPLLRWYL